MPYKIGERTVYREGEDQEQFPSNTLATGEILDFQTLRAKAKASGVPFKDPEFDVENNDVINDSSIQNSQATLVWKRPKEIDPNNLFSKPAEDGKRYALGEIVQGGLGDCGRVSSIEILTTNTKLINFVIPEDNNEDESQGIFHFRFWVKGKFLDMVVDDRLAFWDWGEGYVPRYQVVFVQIKQNEFWPALVEKALAKLYGTYGALDGGIISDTVQDFTGGVSESYALTDKKPSFEDLEPTTPVKGIFGSYFRTLAGFDTENNPPPGMVSGHAYGLVGTATTRTNSGDTVQLLRIRNPWGHDGEWGGNWSDNSSIWDTISVEEKDRLLDIKNDGEFWIDYKEAVSSTVFANVYFCYWLDDLDSTIPADREWNYYSTILAGSGSNPGYSWEDISHRPQNLLRIPEQDSGSGEGIPIIISIIYQNYLIKQIPELDFGMYKLQNPQLKPPFGVKSFEYGGPDSVTEYKRTTFKRYSRSREDAVYTRVTPGAYLIIPYFAGPLGEEQDFIVRIFSEGKFRLTLASSTNSASGSSDEGSSGSGSD